jgi:N-acetylglucosamine malate deacetylase 2
LTVQLAMRMTDQHQFATTEDGLVRRALNDLMAARRIETPVLVVTAHPDDETLAMGGRLRHIEQLRLIQLTDGAPLCEADAKRAGFGNRASYAAEREREAERALAVLGLDCARVQVGAPDRASVFLLSELLPQIERELRHASIVFTHAYEGGHPDHDTAALLVQLGCDRIRSAGSTPPLRLEFSSYHHRAGKLVTGQFWSDPTCPETVVCLDEESANLKRRALAEYRTQAAVVDWFYPGEECYRGAPRYDFAKPPPPGIAQYDLFGWSMTSACWRQTARSFAAEPRA